MKRTKIFGAASTMVLLAVSFFASRAAKKFSGIATVYAFDSNSSQYFTIWSGASVDNLVTTTGSNHASIKEGTTSYQLYENDNGSYVTLFALSL